MLSAHVHAHAHTSDDPPTPRGCYAVLCKTNCLYTFHAICDMLAYGSYVIRPL